MIKKTIFMVGLLVMTVVLAACGSNSDQDLYEKIMADGKIVVGTSGVYAPFTYYEGNELTGFDVEMAREVANRLGVEIEFSLTEWDGLLAGLNVGRFDLVAHQVWRTEQREETYTLTDSYMLSTPVLVVREDNTDIRTLDDVEGKVGGHSETSVYANMTRDHGGRVEVITSFTEQALNIINRRIDYTVNNEGVIAWYLSQNPDAELIAFPLELDTQFEVVFALPGTNADALQERINEIIEEIKEDGTFEEIYNRFLKID